MAANTGTADENCFKFSSVVHGFHVYRNIWSPKLDEVLICQRDVNNSVDKHAVSVLKNGHTVGHVPREHAKIFNFYLKRGGSISCQITSKKTARGVGIEIPALYIFQGEKKDTEAPPFLLKESK